MVGSLDTDWTEVLETRRLTYHVLLGLTLSGWKLEDLWGMLRRADLRVAPHIEGICLRLAERHQSRGVALPERVKPRIAHTALRISHVCQNTTEIAG